MYQPCPWQRELKLLRAIRAILTANGCFYSCCGNEDDHEPRSSGLHVSRARYRMSPVTEHGLMLDPRSLLPDEDLAHGSEGDALAHDKWRQFMELLWRLRRPTYATFHDVEIAAVMLLTILIASLAIWCLS